MDFTGIFFCKGRCEEEVRRRIQAGWMSWKKVSGVLCDRKLSARVKVKCTRVLFDRPCFMEWKRWQCWKDKWEKMEVAGLKMVRWAPGVPRKNKIRNEYVRGTAKIAKLGDKVRNARLRWCEHVKRREEGYVRKRL